MKSEVYLQSSQVYEQVSQVFLKVCSQGFSQVSSKVTICSKCAHYTIVLGSAPKCAHSHLLTSFS